MRVRHLQTCLSENALLQQSSVHTLRGMRVGVDAVYWLRSLKALTDPLAEALGGLPPSLFAVLSQQISFFRENRLSPLFIFHGLQPRSHSLFSSQLQQQMDDAWSVYAREKYGLDERGSSMSAADAQSQVPPPQQRYDQQQERNTEGAFEEYHYGKGSSCEEECLQPQCEREACHPNGGERRKISISESSNSGAHERGCEGAGEGVACERGSLECGAVELERMAVSNSVSLYNGEYCIPLLSERDVRERTGVFGVSSRATCSSSSRGLSLQSPHDAATSAAFTPALSSGASSSSCPHQLNAWASPFPTPQAHALCMKPANIQYPPLRTLAPAASGASSPLASSSATTAAVPHPHSCTTISGSSFSPASAAPPDAAASHPPSTVSSVPPCPCTAASSSLPASAASAAVFAPLAASSSASAAPTAEADSSLVHSKDPALGSFSFTSTGAGDLDSSSTHFTHAPQSGDGNVAPSETACQKFGAAAFVLRGELTESAFHILKSLGCECLHAPFLAAAQLAYFAQQGLLDAIWGPPSLLLFGVPRVVLQVQWDEQKFSWLESSQLLQQWRISQEQLVDACLLAGTEYCLTFPYLNLLQFHRRQAKFDFLTAVEFIRQAPLEVYLHHFPDEDMRKDHVDGYTLCKALVQYPMVMRLSGEVAPLPQQRQQQLHTTAASSSNNTAVVAEAVPCVEEAVLLPRDYHKVVGRRLPFSLYFLMGQGILSRKIVSAIALRQWFDYSPPCVDSLEYRDILIDIRKLRCKVLGMIICGLHPAFRERKIRFRRQAGALTGAGEEGEALQSLKPIIPHAARRCWKTDDTKLQREIIRQQTTRIDFKFCLSWLSASSSNGVSPVAPSTSARENAPPASAFTVGGAPAADPATAAAARAAASVLVDSASNASRTSSRRLGIVRIHPLFFTRAEDAAAAAASTQCPRPLPRVSATVALKAAAPFSAAEVSTLSAAASTTAVESSESTSLTEKAPANLQKTGKTRFFPLCYWREQRQSLDSLVALVHFMVLDVLQLFSTKGEETIFGRILVKAPSNVQEDVLCLLQLLKIGMLTGDALTVPPDRPAPPLLLRSLSAKTAKNRSILLLSRVCSLLPLHVRADSGHWQGDIDYDLAAYSAIVRVVKRTLRQLTEACLANIFLQDMSKVKLLPEGFFDPLRSRFPCFFQTRNCMGVVMKFFLRYSPTRDADAASAASFQAESASVSSGNSAAPATAAGALSASSASEEAATSKAKAERTEMLEVTTSIESHFHTGAITAKAVSTDAEKRESALAGFERAVRQAFPNCMDPLSDLCRATAFWLDIRKLLLEVCAELDAKKLKADVEKATKLLLAQCFSTGLDDYAAFPTEAFEDDAYYTSDDDLPSPRTNGTF